MFYEIHLFFKIWNIPDKTFVKSFMKLGFPCIKTVKKIYLERTVQPITLESILEEYSLGTINKKPKEESKNEPKIENKEILSLKNLMTRRPDTIKVRLLSNIKLFATKTTNQPCDTLLIHIHGGGFISMASNSHQCYTRL